MKIHASGEDYLEAVLDSSKEAWAWSAPLILPGTWAFAKPSISHAVGVLRDGGFLTMDEDGFLHLTDHRPGGGRENL